MRSLLLLLTIGMTIPACRTGNPSGENLPGAQEERGVFIINEGVFGGSAGSVSFFNMATNTVFPSVIGQEAGWLVPNDARVVNGKLYVVVNGGDRVYVRDAATFGSVDSIAMPAGSGPGWLAVADSTRAYVANYNGTVSLVNLAARIVIQTGPRVVAFPGGIATHAGYVYVSDFGPYGTPGKMVKVLDGTSLTVMDSVRVGETPGAMAVAGKRIYLVSLGVYPGKGALYTIDVSVPARPAVIDSLTLGESPSDVAFKDGALFVLHPDRVMKVQPDPLRVADTSFVRLSNALYFYAMQVDPETGDIYVSQIVSTGGLGRVAVYTQAGVQRRDPFGVGYFPGAFAFK